MGNTASWLSGYLFPEEQALWHAASRGDDRELRGAISTLTPETRRYLEWRDPCSGRTPLAQAAANGKLECAKLLVAAGVNVNAKDFKGNTPLHLACRFGHSELVTFLVHLVSVVPFEANLRLLTPLDVARDRLRKRDENRELPTSSRSVAYEQCITELEKKFYIYSGWLYEKADNLLSAASGMSSLSSWKHRYCLVLQRGLPDILELALFSLKKGGARPVLPKSVILYHVQTGIVEATDGKWFNRKDHAFKAQGSILLRDGYCEERGRHVAVTHTVEFAAADAGNLELWKGFFTHQQEMLAVAQGRPFPSHAAAPSAAASSPPDPPLPVYSTPSKTCSPSSYPAELGRESHSRSATSSSTSVATTMSLLRDEDEEDEQLRQAIELSLLEAKRGDLLADAAGAAPDSFYPRVSIPSSSAPAWTDDEADGLSGSYTGRSDASSEGDRSHHHPAHASPGESTQAVMSFSRAPVTTSIGECVICFDGPQTAVCVPCGHNAMCMGCAEEVMESTCECPVCRRPIRELIKLYRV